MFARKKLLIQLEFENQYIYQITSDELDHTILIGRDRLCEWRIPRTDRSASNRHAELFSRRGRVYIKDLNSHNGVYFLGEKITQRAVSPGERYGIGDAILVVSKCEEDKNRKAVQKYHRLEQLNGKNRKKVYELSQSEYTIGSAHDADIRIEDSMVSQHHARLEIKNDGSCWITDTGSRNGTLINRMSLSSENTEGRMLQQGDIISIASVDFYFNDKNATVQKSYFLLKALCAVITAAILLSAYFFWQSLLPDAKAYIERARKYAEIKQFDTALMLLKKSQEAPKAETYKAEFMDLQKQIENWKNTDWKWKQVKQLLLDRSWDPGNKILVGLTAAKNDIWNWNDSDAIRDRRQALLTAEVLEPFLYGRILLAESETTVSALEQDQVRLDRALKKIAAIRDGHFPLLYSEGKLVSEELSYVTNGLKNIEKTVTSIRTERDLGQEISLLRKIYANAAKRSWSRDKKSRKLTDNLILERCKLYLPPLESLAAAQKQFFDNRKALASLEFSRCRKTLSLPAPEQCIPSPLFTVVRGELLNRNEILHQRGEQLKFMIGSLKSSGIDTGKQPAVLQEWQTKSFFDALLSCDCFQYAAPKWSSRRPGPIGIYDRFLGIELFWDFLLDLPQKYDESLADERPFTPEIVRIRKIYNDLDMFKTFLDDPVVAWLLEADVKEPRLQNFALWADELLLKRDKTLTEFIRFSKASGNLRQSLIAGGAALILDNGKNKISFGEYDRLAGVLKALRRETSRIANQDAAPEEIIRNRRKIVAVGLPGDPTVRRAINDMAEEKQK